MQAIIIKYVFDMHLSIYNNYDLLMRLYMN